ncbi:MAG: serine hydrolase [Pseudomonadota bacterium]
MMKQTSILLQICIALLLATFPASSAYAEKFAGLWHSIAPGLEPGLDTSGMMSLNISKTADEKYTAQFTYADRVPPDPGTPPSLIAKDGQLTMLIPGMWPIPSGGRYFEQPVIAKITSVGDGSSLNVTLSDAGGYQLNLNFYPDTDARFDRFKSARLNADGKPTTDYKYSAPTSLSSGFTISTPKAEGLNIGSIEKAVTQYMAGQYNERPGFLLIVRNGKLILEEYFFGATPDRLWLQHSVSKSITSLLVGVAVEDGVFDIDEPINQYFSEYADTPWMKSTGKAGVTPRHLLTMANILGWGDRNFMSAGSPFLTTFMHPDGFTGGMFQNPVLTTKPDPYFNYSTQITNLLGETLARATKTHLSKYMQEKLLAPLGEERSFFLTESGVEGDPVEAGSTVGIRPIAMAKIGQLMLNRGKWNGKQIISKDWVSQSTTVAAIRPNPSTDGYAFSWWHRKYDFNAFENPVRMVSANGRAGQFICIFPDLNTVIVTGGLSFEQPAQTQLDFVEEHLLPAFNNGNAVERLEFGPEDLGVKVLN